MADNIITTNITAHADFTSLRAQLAAVTAQLVKLQETTAGTNAKLANQIAVMNKSFATTLTSTGQFSQHFVSLSSDVDKFGKNLDRGRLKLNDYYNAWNGHTKKTSTLIRDLAKQQVMLQQAVVQPIGKNAQGLMQYNVMVAKGLDEVKNKMAIARQEAAIMNKVMLDGSTGLINWGKNTQWAGRQLTVGLTVPLVMFGAAAQKAFREADAELVRLTKVYGGLAATSSADLAQVRKDVTATAKEIASSYGVAYKETIALAADLAATGQQGNELIAATQQTTRLAVLGEVDRQDAMKATLAIQNAFKQSTDELAQSIDFLNAVENQTSTSLADLTEAIPKAGPVIKSLGGDVKDLALYLTAMKEGGVNASEGANAIKSAMASLINPTKVATEQFAGFGIDLKGIVNNNAGNLTATIVELQGALDKLNPLDKSRAIEQLFGKFQFARMSALFENLGKSGSQTLQVMDLMKASAVDLASISERELKMMTESASGQFKRAWAAVQADLASVGEQFLRISTKVLKVVDAIIKFFQNLPGPVKTFLNALGGLTAIAGPLIMMAGVMGNFIGYVVKGIFHLRQLAKGGQGFKLLTPEIIAADAAAKGLATSFYSDSEATIVLSNAVNTLAESFINLEAKANAAKVSVQPAVSTVAGGVIMSGTAAGGRVVDKDNPLVGRPYSRDMSHLIPSGIPQMGTIFGTVPGAKPVNIRVGRNPQAYMDGDLPKIPGLTSIGGTSTGIVAGEAAKWHAMTAAIAMQSQEELAILKKEVMATGTVTSSLSDSYKALLPEFSEITQLAAAETAAIVQQVQQNKITVEAARAKIISLNATVEAMLAETTRLTAAGMGRTANLSIVPLTSQPVVDPVTGKSNMKEMFHKGSVKEMADRIARALGGVRTSGAGYNIATTKPKFAKGGFVPGTGNTDTYHTTAEPGSFVINKASTQENLPMITNILGSKSYYAQEGGQVPVVLTPGEAVIPAAIAQKNMPLMYELNGGPGNTSGGEGHLRGGTIVDIIRAVTQRGRQYRAKALLDNAGIPVTKLQNSVYPFLHKLNLRTRGGGKVSAREFAETFESPDAFNLANAVLRKNGLKPISKEQHESINSYLKNVDNINPEEMLTEAGFGTYLTRAYQSAGVSKDQLLALAGKHTMRFSFPGSGTIVQRRDGLIKTLKDKYPEGTFSVDPRTDNNIIVKLPGQKPFKIEHEATRSIHGATGGVSYETLRQAIPAGANAEGKLAYGHLPIDETLLNAGGMVPGGISQRLFPGGVARFLGMPRSIKAVEAQRAAKTAMEKASQAVADSRFARKPVTEYGELLEPTSGRSFPVPGIGGLYSKGGERVFVKPVLDEKAALAEMRATEIARDVHGLHAPKQKVVVMKDPTDPTGRRKVLALESPYDARLAYKDPDFTADEYFKQLVASALRGDKDLARGNLSGNVLSDVGTAGVFSTASGLREYSSIMPSMRDQSITNLLGRKGSGAKKFFAESTTDIPKGMTSDQYHDRMISEIEVALPKLKQTIGRFDLNSEEKTVYQAMIKRLSDARAVNWRELHGIHSAVVPSVDKQMTPAAIAKMIAADELKRRQMGHSVSLSDNAFKTPENGFVLGGLLGAITKGKAMHRLGAGFGKDSTGGWGVTSLQIGMAEKLFASTGLTKRTQRLFYDKLTAELAREMPYGYEKDAMGRLMKAIEPNVMDSVIRSSAGSVLSDPAGRKVLSAIDREILRKKFANWESKKDTPLTESLKKLVFNMEGREKGGSVNSGQPYIVGEKGPEIFVPRNAGGIVPNSRSMAQGYNAGGMIKMLLMQMLGMYGGQALGKASGIPGGEMVGMMLGSMLGMGGMGRGKDMQDGPEMPVKAQSKLTRPMFSAARGTDGKILSNYGAGLEKLSASKNVFAKTAVFAAKSLTRLNLLVAAGAAAIYIAKNRYDAYNESMRLNAVGYGMTAEAASKAGLKYTDFNTKIKEAVENAKALRERNILLYESMKGSNTPLNITIEEYKKLKKEVKDNYSDQVLLINKTSTDDQEALAVRLKTQLMAMGLSAEEAGKKIYAMYAASKFAFAAAKYTVGNDIFKGIEDSSDAAIKAIEALSIAMESGLNPKEQFNQLNTTMMAISASIEDRQAKAIKASKTEYKKDNRYFGAADEGRIKIEQERAALAELNKTIESQAVLTSEVVDEMAAIDPSIRQIINSQDTSLSLWQKTRLQVNGFTGDLKGLSAAQADALYSLQIETKKIVQQTASAPGGILSKQYKDLNRLKEAQAAYEKAAKGQRVEQQISDRNKIAALQKQIDANNKLADARIKALDAAKKEGDIAREIAKAQARYEAALATGNTADAQQASLDMQGLQSNLQYEAQVKAIENATTLKNAPLLKQIELIQKKQQDVADAAALAGQKLGDVSKSIGTLETGIDNVISAMTNYRVQMSRVPASILEDWKATGVGAGLIAAVTEAAKNANVSVPGMTKDKNGNYGLDDGTLFVDEWEKALKNMTTSTFDINGNVTVNINGKKLNTGTVGSGTYKDPKQGGQVSSALGNNMAGLPNRKTLKGVWETGLWNSTREMVKDYAKEMGYTKDQYFTLVNEDGSSTMFKVNDNKGNIIKVKEIPKPATKHDGGSVSGPGTGTSDSIPAYLSNGEYVIKEKSVRKYGVETFDALNAGKFADGGLAGKDPSKISVGDGESLPVKPYGSIFERKRLDPKDFKTPGEYYAAVGKIRKEGEFFTAPQTKYPIDHIESPMGSLQRFLDIARSQIGSDHAYQMHTDFYPKGIDSNATKFSLWGNQKYKLGSDILNWCGQFIAWVAENSGVGLSTKMFSGIQAVKDYKKKGLFNDLTNKENLENVKVGDLAWYDWNAPDNGYTKDGVPDHAVIVSGISKGLLRTIGQYGDGRISERTDERRIQGMLLGSASPEFKKFANGGHVIKAKAVRRYGVDTFDALNTEKFHKGGPVGHKHLSPGHMASNYKAPYSGPSMSALSPAKAAANSKATDKFYEKNGNYSKNENGEWVKNPPSLWETFTTGKNWTAAIGGNNPGGPIHTEMQNILLSALVGPGGAQRYQDGRDWAKGEYLTAAINVALARVGGAHGNALMRSFVEMLGASKGIPNLGHLLPKGSIPFLGATGSKFVQNAIPAVMVGTARPFMDNLSPAMSSSTLRPPSISQQASRPGVSDEMQQTLTQSLSAGEASRMAIQNQINLATSIAKSEGRFAPRLIGTGSVATIDNPRYLFQELLDGNADDIMQWPWRPSIKTDAADPYARQKPMWWESLYTQAPVEKLSYKQKKMIAMLAGIKVPIGKPFPKITQTQMDEGYHAFYKNEELVKKWGGWSDYRDAMLKSVGLDRPMPEKSRFVPYNEAAALKASLEDVRLKNVDGTDSFAFKYTIGGAEADPRWSTAFGSKTSVIGGGAGDRGALMLDGDLGAAMRSQYAIVYEDLIKTGFIRRARIDKNGKRIEQKDLAPLPTAGRYYRAAMTLDEFLLHVSSQLPGVTTSSRLMTGTANELVSRPSPFIQALNESYVKNVLGMGVEDSFRFTKYDIHGSPLVDKFGNPKAGGYYSLDEGFDYATNPGSRNYGTPPSPGSKLTKGKFTIDLLPREFPSPVFAGGGFTDEMAIIVPEWLAIAKSKHVAKLDPKHFTKPMSADYGRYLHASRFFKPTEGWTVDDATAAAGGMFGIQKDQFGILADLLNTGKVKTSVVNDGRFGAEKAAKEVTPWTEDDLWKIVTGYNTNAIIKEGNTRRINPDWLQGMSGNSYSSLEQMLKVEELVNLMRIHIQDLPPISMVEPKVAVKPKVSVNVGRPRMAEGGYVNPSYSPNVNIPKFETGINNVPADMLAMLHKNEAVVPANMNPFNPNANNATMSGATYNITNNINGFDGDINQLSNIVTQKTITAIGSLTARTAAMSGPTMTVGIK